jgi:hypothetical protein
LGSTDTGMKQRADDWRRPPLHTRSAKHHCGGRWWVEGRGRRSMRQRLWLGRTYNPSQSARWRPHLPCVFLLLHLPSGLGSFRGGHGRWGHWPSTTSAVRSVCGGGGGGGEAGSDPTLCLIPATLAKKKGDGVHRLGLHRHLRMHRRSYALSRVFNEVRSTSGSTGFWNTPVSPRSCGDMF